MEAELVAGLSLLEAGYEGDSSQTLVLMGSTLDVSSTGVALVLPLIRIDADHLDESPPVALALHLPRAPIHMKIKPVRCVPLEKLDPSRGYIIGAAITELEKFATDWQQYLSSLRNSPG